MPAQAGIQELQATACGYYAWIPASTGMTNSDPGLFKELKRQDTSRSSSLNLRRMIIRRNGGNQSDKAAIGYCNGRVIWSFGRAMMAQRLHNAARGLICAFLAWPRCKRLRCAVQPGLPGLRQLVARRVRCSGADVLRRVRLRGCANSKEYLIKAVFLWRLAQFTQ